MYFSYLPNLIVALDKLNVLKAASINILLQGLNTEEDSKPYTLNYKILYKVMNSVMSNAKIFGTKGGPSFSMQA